MNDPLVAVFPGLARGYRITSPATNDYNCLAWAAGRDDRWWWPGHPDAFWPPGVPAAATVATFAAAYRSIGYEACVSGVLELRFDKIVIFADAAGVPTHAARQLVRGTWTSKLGRDVDIEHRAPESLTSVDYGAPVLFMKRRRPFWRRMAAFALTILARLGRASSR